MPARTVVIEKLTKFTGDHHESLTPGEYTQLTGRAGRRGIDDQGHAVVLWSPFVAFEQVAALASSRTFHLRSAFRPTYNMAANLVRTYSSEDAHHLLNLSFAQFQSDRDVVRLEARLERRAGGDRRGAGRGRAARSATSGSTAGRSTQRRDAGAGRDDPVELALLQLRPGRGGPRRARASYHGPGGRRRQRPPQGRAAPDDDHAARPTSLLLDGRRLRRLPHAARRRSSCPARLRPEPRRVPQARSRGAGRHAKLAAGPTAAAAGERR